MLPRLFALGLASLVLIGATAPVGPTGIGGSGPIDIQTAGGDADIDRSNCSYTIRGGVRVTQGLVRLQARTIAVSGQPRACPGHFEATDQVFYVTPLRTVKADKAVYDAATATAVFTSTSPNGVVMVEGRNVFAASKVTINTTTQRYNVEGGLRTIYYPEDSYVAAGNGWNLLTSAAALSLTRTGGAPIDVANPGMVNTADVLSWTTSSLKLTLTPGDCSFGGKPFDYVAQVQAGAATYSGCGGPASDGAS